MALTLDPTRPDPASAPRPGARLGVVSTKIARIPDLPAFFPPGVRLLRMPFAHTRLDMLVGWGLGRTGQRARRIAGGLGLPVLTLEDGFLRSAGLGVEGARPLSIVADDIGIHIDARAPSRLERLLQEGGWESPTLAARARAAMAEIRRLRLSKYNLPRQRARATPPRGPFVLLVDQSEGDASIAAGLARPESFRAMLRAAREENPGSRLMLRVHPDVVAGRRRGCLSPFARELGLELLDPALDPWDAIEACERV